MKNRVSRNWFLIIAGLIFIINVGLVLGASTNILDQVLGSISSGKDLVLGQVYQKYPQLIDAIFYFVFFIGISKAVLSKVPTFKDSNTIPVVIGIMLALSMSVFAYMNHISLINDLGPYALILIMAVFGIFMYNIMKGTFKWNTIFSIALAGLLVFAIFNIGMIAGKNAKISSSPAVQSMQSNKAIQNGMTTGESILMVMLLIGGIKQFGSGIKFPTATGSEHTDAKTFFPGQTDTLDKVEGVEKGLEPAVKGDKTEKDLLNEEEGIGDLDQLKNALDAQSMKFATQLEESKNNEYAGEQKEAAMLTALSGYTSNIDNVLGRMNDVQAMDDAGKQYMLQQIQGIAQVCVQITENQKKLNENRKNTVGKLLNEDITKINDIINKFKQIELSLRKIEQRITSDIGQSLIKKVESHIKDQQKKLDLLAKELSSSKTSEIARQNIGPAIDALHTEIQTNNTELAKLNSMKEEINNYVKELDKTFVAIRDILQDMDLAKKKINYQAQKNTKFLSNFDKSVVQMDGAAKMLNHNMIELGQQTEIIEEIPAKAIGNVGTIFDRMISTDPNKFGLQLQMKKFYAEDIIPSIDDINLIIKNGARLDGPISAIQTSIASIQNAYVNLKKAAEAIIGNTPKSMDASNKLSQVTGYVKALVASEAGTRTNMTNQAIGRLDRIKSSLTGEVQKIDVETQNLQNAEKRVIGELSKALTIIVKNKSRVDVKFKQGADAFNQNMAQATQKINEQRKTI